MPPDNIGDLSLSSHDSASSPIWRSWLETGLVRFTRGILVKRRTWCAGRRVGQLQQSGDRFGEYLVTRGFLRLSDLEARPWLRFPRFSGSWARPWSGSDSCAARRVSALVRSRCATP